jgi:diguanylate cyclase (GGDEF)-like protein
MRFRLSVFRKKVSGVRVRFMAMIRCYRGGIEGFKGMKDSMVGNTSAGAPVLQSRTVVERGVKSWFSVPAMDVSWSYPDADSAELLAEFDTEVGKSKFSMLFTDRLEACFQASQNQLRLRIFMLFMPASCFVSLMFLSTDRLMFPDVFWLSVLLKTVVNMPLALACYILALRFPGKVNLIVVLISIAMQLQILAFLFLSTSPYVAPLVYALALVCVVTNAAYALDFRLAVFMVAETVAMLLAAVMLSGNMNPVTSRFGFGVCLCFCIYSLMGTYRVESGQRVSFILGLREKMRADALTVANSKLTQEVVIDGLTGVHNRRHFDNCLHSLWQNHRDAGTSLGLLLVDIDHFKALNDEYGHLVGDYCLQQAATVMAQEIRGKSDILVRFGGEEFAILLPGADLKASFEVAERLRQRVEKLRIYLEDKPEPIGFTVSIGCHATVPSEGKLARKFLSDVDEAMYDAKKGGRNMVSTQVMKQSLAEAEMRRRGMATIVGTTG